ncbi:reverse transcriptase like protein [Gossypium australe]|uniref:Reverse transcriptase like protein n=1 Tax=Gossypium australe TaxID=47621 RepID=A0A5B6U7S5_9ROSI|nr:reverse transcriptase like protein [Gossypium australe]
MSPPLGPFGNVLKSLFPTPLKNRLLHPGFENFDGDNWKFSRDLSDALSKFTNNLKEWNKSIYGHITMQKENLINKLGDIQRRMDIYGSNQLAQDKMKVRQELQNVLHHEDLIWKQ